MVYDSGEELGYLMIVEGVDSDEVLEGRVEVKGINGFIFPPRRRWTKRKRLVDRVMESVPKFALKIASWELVNGSQVSLRYPELRMEDFLPDRWETLAGFIATAFNRGDRSFLLPLLQADYAVLDWENLHKSRSLARLFRSGRLGSLGAELVVNDNIEPVLAELKEQWKERSWLKPEYLALMRALARDVRDEFRLEAIELRVKDENRPVAGELGYSMGLAYTSLSGFHRRDKKEWNDLGKVQLHLLADRLRDRGYSFWNLGYLPMRYKLDLGARPVGRVDFLQRWNAAIVEPLVPLA
jgi:Leu/Phe-tRNA-protein transferase